MSSSSLPVEEREDATPATPDAASVDVPKDANRLSAEVSPAADDLSANSSIDIGPPVEHDGPEDYSQAPKYSVLMMGRTGTGKSTLANVLAGVMDDTMFNVGYFCESETAEVEAKRRETPLGLIEVIDTCGFCDNRLPADQTLKQLQTVAESTVGYVHGINQIFFLTEKRITEDDAHAFRILKDIFDENVYRFVTIVRTHCENFENLAFCKQDIDWMEKNPCADFMVELVGRNKVVHVDMPIVKDDKSRKPEWIKKRRRSLERVVARLATCTDRYLPLQVKEQFEKLLADGRSDDEAAARRAEIHKLLYQLDEEKRKARQMERELGSVKDDLKKEKDEREKREAGMSDRIADLERNLRELLEKQQEADRRENQDQERPGGPVPPENPKKSSCIIL